MTESDPAEFCERIRGRLVGSLSLYCGDRAVADELAQEALVRAWERWATVGQMVSPEAWTFRTGTNLANSWFRRRAAERRANRRHGSGGGPTVEPDAAASLAVRAEGTVKAATHAAIANLRASGLVNEHEPEGDRA